MRPYNVSVSTSVAGPAVSVLMPAVSAMSAAIVVRPSKLSYDPLVRLAGVRRVDLDDE